MEKELIKKAQEGDFKGAKRILNQLWGDILFKAAGDLDMLKVKTLGVFLSLCEAALEEGKDAELLMGLNYSYLSEISCLDDEEGIYRWIIKVMNNFLNIFSLSPKKGDYKLKKALSYIVTHHAESITLEEVAKQVSLSSDYFSFLFKKELGQNFSQYLRKVRIEKSKQLLDDLNRTLVEIALQVGFKDQSYFSTVFKEIEGVTPFQYRKSLR